MRTHACSLTARIFANATAQRSKLKHIDCHQEWVKTLRNKNVCNTVHIPTKDNLADIFTKILPSAGCLIPKPRGRQRRSRVPRGPAAPFPHLAACLLGARVFRLVPGSPQVCEPENLARHGMHFIEAVARELFVPMLRCLQPLTPLHPQLS